MKGAFKAEKNKLYFVQRSTEPLKSQVRKRSIVHIFNKTQHCTYTRATILICNVSSDVENKLQVKYGVVSSPWLHWYRICLFQCDSYFQPPPLVYTVFCIHHIARIKLQIFILGWQLFHELTYLIKAKVKLKWPLEDPQWCSAPLREQNITQRSLVATIFARK